MVLPASIARWSLFNHKKVTSAATFFAAPIFTLSGAINVLLLLVVRPQLLLFTRPEDYELDAVAPGPAHLTTDSPIIPDTSNQNLWLTPQPNVRAVPDDAADRAWDLNLDGINIPLAHLESRSVDV